MPKLSAGILLHRAGPAGVELLLVHPGGPFWARKDEGAWSIPKGEYEAGEAPEAAARREFAEELGIEPPPGPLLPLGEARQSGGKRVTAFALAGDLDPAAVRSNLVEIAWPPRSGRTLRVPEIDRAGWFAPDAARTKLLQAQRPFVDRLLERLES